MLSPGFRKNQIYSAGKDFELTDICLVGASYVDLQVALLVASPWWAIDVNWNLGRAHGRANGWNMDWFLINPAVILHSPITLSGY